MERLKGKTVSSVVSGSDGEYVIKTDDGEEFKVSAEIDDSQSSKPYIFFRENYTEPPSRESLVADGYYGVDIGFSHGSVSFFSEVYDYAHNSSYSELLEIDSEILAFMKKEEEFYSTRSKERFIFSTEGEEFGSHVYVECKNGKDVEVSLFIDNTEEVRLSGDDEEMPRIFEESATRVITLEQWCYIVNYVEAYS